MSAAAIILTILAGVLAGALAALGPRPVPVPISGERK